MTQELRCPFCGEKPTVNTMYNIGEEMRSCPNRNCPIGSIAMTLEQWENRYIGSYPVKEALADE